MLARRGPGDIGSCTAHAAIALVEYFEIRTQQKHIDASRLFLYKVSRNLLNWHGDTGAYLRTAMEALVLFGVPPERYMPYAPENFDSEPSAFCYAFGQSFQTASYYRLDPLGTRPDRLLKDIKVSLAAGYPLMFGFTVYDSLGRRRTTRAKCRSPRRRTARCLEGTPLRPSGMMTASSSGTANREAFPPVAPSASGTPGDRGGATRATGGCPTTSF